MKIREVIGFPFLLCALLLAIIALCLAFIAERISGGTQILTYIKEELEKCTAEKNGGK